ncbi:TolC family protein [Porphyromonas gulae]|uniref:Transporter n=1 Tax=Porphyromonas gulae TaxID=111105 RepID=A0A0A2F0Z2_9PORP|nr:TolC family protein [Porphyromonas gulae]KGN84681.1 transporter [Porphyromonas gulae]
MKAIFISILAILATTPLWAQKGMSDVLRAIEENNTTLKALRESTEAEKLNNRTGIFLSNPEVEVGYLWGNPAEIGNRTDFSITQSFDIPTITGMKSRAAKMQDKLLDWRYKTDRMNILLEAKTCCIELIYNNALLLELARRLRHATTIAEGYEARLKAGDTNQLEYNKVKLNLAAVQGEISRVEVERNALLVRLKRLNGGIEIVFDESRYPEVILPQDFAAWFDGVAEKNPQLTYAREEVVASKQQVALSRATGLPTFSAGYVSEKVGGERFQGVSFGISVPLWENKNRIRQAKASTRAAEMREADTRQQLYSGLQLLYERAVGLKATAEGYRKLLTTSDNADLLKKALDTGKISLLDYIVEMGLYYDTVSRAMEAERDYQQAFAELWAVDL